MRHLLLLLCLSFVLVSLSAQGLRGDRNQDKALLLNFSYGPTLTAADLANRFDNPWSIEISVDYTPRESAWMFGVMGQYLFGNNIKEDILANLRLSNGSVVGDQRSPADLQLRMRGYFLGVRASRIISFGENERAGLKLSGGIGWLSHQIRIQEDVNQEVNQIARDYLKGYDRLTSGPALYQFVGYQQLSRNGRVNFFLGAEFIEGFTRSQRDFDFATTGSLDGSRLDVVIGFRAGLILPLYLGNGEEIFYRK